MLKNPTTFPPNESHFLLNGPAGLLELVTLNTIHPAKAIAIICHPHPLYEGTMHNKVVHTLSRAFFRKEIASVRFNFRGVGKSEGEHDFSIGEVEDLMVVIDWVKRVAPDKNIILAGFSFGAYIAAKGASQIDCAQLFSIAPAVTNQPYDTLAVRCPWIVIQGENDEVIDPQVVFTWHETHPQANRLLIKMPNTSHFFHGKLIELRTIVEDNLL